jgi:hypothetical protein
MSTETPSLHDQPTLPRPPVSDEATLPLPPVTGEPPEPPPVPGSQPPEPPLPHRHRRAALIALISGAAVLVIGVPLVLLAVLGGGSGGNAGPSASASAPAGSASVQPSPSGTGRASAPDGRIPLSVLRNASLFIPSWPADNRQGPSGQLRFHNGEAVQTATNSTGPHVLIQRVAYGDVDRDGAQETIVEVDCVIQGGAQQLVALDRDTAGRIVTMGTVVSTTGQVRSISTQPVTVASTGVVTAQVGDYQNCCGDQTPVQYQWRGYAWRDGQFEQVAGQTTFPVNPSVTELSVNAGEVVLGAPVDGVRHGTLTLTVAYLRGTRPDHLILWFQPPANLQPEGNAWPPSHPAAGSGFEIYLPTPAQGTGHTYTFGFRQAAGTDAQPMGVFLRGVTAGNGRLSESNPYNNNLTVTVRFTG